MNDDADKTIIRRELDTDRENPAVQVAEHVAEMEGKDATDLTTMYGCVDNVLDNLFSDPPNSEAQMEIKLSYESYRITISQDGMAEFVKTE